MTTTTPAGGDQYVDRPEAVHLAAAAAAVVERERRPRPGRRPRLSLRERMLMLSDLEHAPPGTTVATIAHRHEVDHGYVRDVLLWGRSRVHGRPLFTTPAPGEGFGELTELGLQVLALATSRGGPGRDARR